MSQLRWIREERDRLHQENVRLSEENRGLQQVFAETTDAACELQDVVDGYLAVLIGAGCGDNNLDVVECLRLLVADRDRAQEENAHLLTENTRFRLVLSQYADKDNWFGHSCDDCWLDGCVWSPTGYGYEPAQAVLEVDTVRCMRPVPQREEKP